MDAVIEPRAFWLRRDHQYGVHEFSGGHEYKHADNDHNLRGAIKRSRPLEGGYLILVDPHVRIFPVSFCPDANTMIFYWIIRVFLYLLDLITVPLLLLPVASLSVNLTGTLTQAGNYLALFDIFLPIGMLLTLFGIVVTIEGGYFTYKVAKWIYNKIPGIN
jgi:hypothetical protein